MSKRTWRENEESFEDRPKYKVEFERAIANKDFESAATALVTYTELSRPPAGPPLDWIFDQSAHEVAGPEDKRSNEHQAAVKLAASKLGLSPSV